MQRQRRAVGRQVALVDYEPFAPVVHDHSVHGRQQVTQHIVAAAPALTRQIKADGSEIIAAIAAVAGIIKTPHNWQIVLLSGIQEHLEYVMQCHWPVLSVASSLELAKAVSGDYLHIIRWRHVRRAVQFWRYIAPPYQHIAIEV